MSIKEQVAVEKPEKARRMVKGIFSRRMAVPGLVIAVGVIWAVFQVTTNGIFLTDRNLINLMRQTAVTAMVALGMLIVIAQGQIDLSVGSLLGLMATLTATLETSGTVPFGVTIIIVLAIGLIAGLWNGIWVGILGIPAFVATLGGLLMFRGISLAVSGGRTISGIREEIRLLGGGFIDGVPLLAFLAAGFAFGLFPLIKLRSVPPERRDRVVRRAVALTIGMIVLSWATLSYRGLPIPVAIALILGGALAWATDNTVWGRHVYAVGSNKAASRVAGIRVRRQVVLGFVLISGLTALAAVVFVGRLGSAPPLAGLFLELDAIAAVVIGGASLYGGSGKVSGALLGALLIQSIQNGLSLMNVETAYQYITGGVVLMIAVFIDAVSKRGGRLVVRL